MTNIWLPRTWRPRVLTADQLARKKELDAIYYQENKEKIKERANAHYQRNRERVLRRQEEKRQLKHAQAAENEHLRWSNNKTKRNRWYRLWFHGMAESEYEEFLRIQNGCCAICKTPFTEEAKTHIDHDHTTNKIRGLLCPHCNRGLGHFHDAPDLLIAAAKYLYSQASDDVKKED